MKKDEFVFRLKQLAPSREDYHRLNFSDDSITELIKRFECNPLNNDLFNSIKNDEILELLNTYDCSKVEIGLLNLNKTVQEFPNYYLIGKIDSDIIALNKITLEIETLDHEGRNHLLWSCAASSKRFLNSILTAAEFFSRRIKDPGLANNKVFTNEYVLNCTDKAGGKKYIDFYKMLLGNFD